MSGGRWVKITLRIRRSTQKSIAISLIVAGENDDKTLGVRGVGGWNEVALVKG